MPESTCVRCGNQTFELVESSPLGSNFKFLFLQCSTCGGVAGVLDYLNIGSILIEQSNLIRKIALTLNVDVEINS
jgi:hypothetical protein